MENRFYRLKNHLHELGYSQNMGVDSVPLVERLLSDLIKTTESLHYYKNIAQEALEEREHLELGAEPYKCDNAKLVKECNDLHLTFTRFKEQTENLQRDLNNRITTLKKEKEELMKRCEKNIRSEKIIKPISKSHLSLNSKPKGSLKSDDFKSKMNGNPVGLKEPKPDQLVKEIKKLKEEKSQQFELIDCLNDKLVNRNKEIERLMNMLEGGRPIQALNKDCCYKDVNSQLYKMSDVNAILVKEKKDLETQLADAIVKQHEAMKRALCLADRNQQLERELKDIDQMALVVEADCNSTVKQNVNKVTQFQEQLNEYSCKILGLERELMELRRSKISLESDIGTIKNEKSNLQIILDNTSEDKKRLTDRINEFSRIEHDLNLEIDNLVKTTTLQKRKISELECQMLNVKYQGEDINSYRNRIHSISRESSSSEHESVCRCCQKCLVTKKKKRNVESQILSTNRSDRRKFSTEKCDTTKISNTECDQCHSLRNELQKLTNQLENYIEIKRKLNEKEQALVNLQHENKDIVREKHELMSRLESAREMSQLDKDLNGVPVKTVISRLEKERDLARNDAVKLEDERDTLRQRIKTLTESSLIERERLQKVLGETEEKLHKIETDRREMISVQGSRRAAINNLEEQVETLTDQLRTTKSELTHIQTVYNQLKTLQEQTDRALADSQGQLTQIEIELSHSQKQAREIEKVHVESEGEMDSLRNDIVILKENLKKIDSEKDSLLTELDDKTEKIADLEQQLKIKEEKILKQDNSLTDLKHKLSLSADNSTSKEYLLKNYTSEIASLRRELENINGMKNNAISENRRLQDDLTAVSSEFRNVNDELEIAKRKIEDLKRQLQQYVHEVKRAEDLMSKKDLERTEMLDQFHSLSHEATILENNNHSLETQALEAKSQLNEALDRISDLRNKVEQHETMNRGYEEQISHLTSQIANMEIQIKQHGSLQNKTEAELSSVKDLCVKLDDQKDKLLKDLADKSAYQSQLELDKDRLQRDLKNLKDNICKEQSSNGTLENLLTSSRQETVEQRLLNQDLQSEISRLKKLVEELQCKLNITSQQLDVFQEKALEYSQQLKQLRREMANERFSRVHSADLSDRYPSL